MLEFMGSWLDGGDVGRGGWWGVGTLTGVGMLTGGWDVNFQY